MKELYEKFKRKEIESPNLEGESPDLEIKSDLEVQSSEELNMSNHNQIALLDEIHEFISKLNHLPKIEFTNKSYSFTHKNTSTTYLS